MGDWGGVGEGGEGGGLVGEGEIRVPATLEVDAFAQAHRGGQPQLKNNNNRNNSNDKHINSLLTVTGKFSAMTGTFLYVFGSSERHSEPTKEMCMPYRPILKGDTVVVCIIWGD